MADGRWQRSEGDKGRIGGVVRVRPGERLRFFVVRFGAVLAFSVQGVRVAAYRRFEDLPVWQDAARLYHAVLDFQRAAGGELSYAFRNQLERAALSVSNNIAEGFERVTVAELLSFLGIARGSAGEVRSMMCVIGGRPEGGRHAAEWQKVRSLAESCSRQIAAWRSSLEAGKVRGARHLTPETRESRARTDAVAKYRRMFLLSLRPGHPQYETEEARQAREAQRRTDQSGDKSMPSGKGDCG